MWCQTKGSEQTESDGRKARLAVEERKMTEVQAESGQKRNVEAVLDPVKDVGLYLKSSEKP